MESFAFELNTYIESFCFFTYTKGEYVARPFPAIVHSSNV